MFQVKLLQKQQSVRKDYRQYSPTSLHNALTKVLNKNMTVYKASKVYGVPKSTLLDRVSGRVGVDVVKSGPAPTLDVEQEARLVDHIKMMANFGYGYTRSEVVDLATDYAVYMELREKTKPFTLNWFYSFMGRWPELKTIKARGLAISRAKSASQENINSYFQELETILVKYHLTDKPHCIYNIDEKGVNFQHKPPNVVGAKESKPPGITSERSPTVTIIGAGNALGTQIPPYLIFAGARMNNSLIEDCTNGTSGSVSGSGWSNTDIFHKYLGEHFIKYAQGLTDDQPVLLIYDGHKSHVALSVIEWAKAHNIIILVLPAHCSHILQPLDVGCFGPLSRILNNSFHKYLREHREPINRYNIGKLATDAYVKALSPHNLKTSFEKTGIYPLEKNCVSAITLLPSTVFTTDIVDPDDAVQNKQTDHDSEHSPSVNSDTGLDLPDTRVYFPDTGNITLIDEADPLPDEDETDILTNNEIQKSPAVFFKQCEKNIGIVVKKQTKKRKYLSNITSGKAITEDDVMADIVAHCKKPKITQVINKKKPKSVNNTSKCKKTKACVENDVKVTKPKKAKKVKVIAKAKNMSPKPGTSGLQKLIISDDDSFDDTCSIEDTDESPCCVCKKRFPEALRQCVSLVFAQWGKCMYPQCDHWTHLRFCCNVNVLRRHSIFYCPCHGLPCLQYEE